MDPRAGRQWITTMWDYLITRNEKRGKKDRAEVGGKMIHIQTPTLSHSANMIYRC